MTVKLTHLLSLVALMAATPALAETTLTLGGDESSSSASAPVELSLSAEPDAASPAMSMAPDDETMDDEPLGGVDQSDQPSGPPLDSKAALQVFFDVCTDLASGDPAAHDRANDSGWMPSDSAAPGPFNTLYSGYKVFAGYGEVDVWGSVQSFPTQRLGYCRVDFSDPDTLINFNDFTGLGGLTGTLETGAGDTVYGTWESADKKLLVIADRTDGSVEIEYNLLLGDKPASN
jgi:hypothetical protein